jgi:hypothetical protein
MADPIDPADLVYDLRVPCCGRVLLVPRANALTRRIEASFGPVVPLAKRLSAASVTTAELASLIALLVEGQPHAPDVAAIEAWLFNAGAAKIAPPLASEVATLVAGNAAVAEWQRERLGSRKSPDDPGPFAKTAA